MFSFFYSSNEKKGALVDVYNKNYRFTGSFYLKLSDRLSYLNYFSFHAYVFGEFLYNIERDKEDNPWIVKYKIITRYDSDNIQK